MKLTYHNRQTGLMVEADQGKSLAEMILQLTPFLQWPARCPFCNPNDIQPPPPGPMPVLNARCPQGNLYVEYLCTQCGATQPWGTYRDGKGMFLKQWQKKFEKQGG